jgi:Glycosyl transferases group 1
MKWFIAAPFITDSSDRWLTAFVPDVEGRSFTFVPATYQHDRSRKFTGLSGWADYFAHGSETWRAARASSKRNGILTCFPQLPIVVGLRKRLTRSPIPVVAWMFNLGQLYGGVRRHMARQTLAAVDKIVVHSTAEVMAYSEWLQMPVERFQFVPMQCAAREITFLEDVDRPFVLSMGSAHRDYKLLFMVLADLGYPAVVVAGPHAVEGLVVPPNVQVQSGLTVAQCHALVQRARINVVPVANRHTASGQVTLLDAMMFSRAVVVTEGPSSVDYVHHGHDAILVRQGDAADMASALRMLWTDDLLRDALGRNARTSMLERFSDEAVGRELGFVLSSLE